VLKGFEALPTARLERLRFPQVQIQSLEGEEQFCQSLVNLLKVQLQSLQASLVLRLVAELAENQHQQKQRNRHQDEQNQGFNHRRGWGDDLVLGPLG
jgi:hypothetical protein